MHQLAFLPQPASFEHTPWSSAKSFWIGSVAAAAGLSSAYEAPKFLLMLTRANVAAERNNGVADNILSNFIDYSISKILLMQLTCKSTVFVNTRWTCHRWSYNATLI